MRGVKRVDDRRVLIRIFWRLRTGAPWADTHILQAVSEVYHGDTQMDRQFLDPGSSARGEWPEKGESYCTGRSHDGLTIKLHMPVDALGRPTRLKLTEGQAHDRHSAVDMYRSSSAGRRCLPNEPMPATRCEHPYRPRCGGQHSPMPIRKRFPVFDVILYSKRNLAERFFSKVKRFQAIVTRYDNSDDNFLASIQPTALAI